THCIHRTNLLNNGRKRAPPSGWQAKKQARSLAQARLKSHRCIGWQRSPPAKPWGKMAVFDRSGGLLSAQEETQHGESVVVRAGIAGGCFGYRSGCAQLASHAAIPAAAPDRAGLAESKSAGQWLAGAVRLPVFHSLAAAN